MVGGCAGALDLVVAMELSLLVRASGVWENPPGPICLSEVHINITYAPFKPLV